MIINTGGRTDTVQYYSEWLLNRFREGFVYSRNPLFPNKVVRYELNPDVVDCVVFCSKDYSPILSDLHEITDRFPTYFHYTISAYGKDVEPGVPSISASVETLKKLSSIVGKQRVAWRYDPVLLTEKYDLAHHEKTFRYIAQNVAPYVDRCIFSFVEMHPRVLRNMPEIIPLDDDAKTRVASMIGRVAAEFDMPVQTCGTSDDYSEFGVSRSGCMTLDILGAANGLEFRNLKHKGLRQGCGCIDSRDVGAYDTCPNCCRYCYANKNPQKVAQNRALHDPSSPILLGHVRPEDTVSKGSQKTYRK